MASCAALAGMRMTLRRLDPGVEFLRDANGCELFQDRRHKSGLNSML